jgi:hypothetical protein
VTVAAGADVLVVFDYLPGDGHVPLEAGWAHNAQTILVARVAL